MRAWIECPECIENSPDLEADLVDMNEKNDKLSARVEELEKELIRAKLKSAQPHGEPLPEERPLVLQQRARIEELEAAIRGAEGLPTWRELFDQVRGIFMEDWRIDYAEYWEYLSDLFENSNKAQLKQLCAALGRDPGSGEKVKG